MGNICESCCGGGTFQGKGQTLGSSSAAQTTGGRTTGTRTATTGAPQPLGMENPSDLKANAARAAEEREKQFATRGTQRKT